MATLREYFDKDGSRTVCLSRPIQIKSQSGEVELEVLGRLHLDFESNSKYVSYYIPRCERLECPSRIILNTIEEVLSWTGQVQMHGGFPGEKLHTTDEMNFTGRVFIYSEDPIRTYLKIA